jgi:hypothetical protein
VLPAGLVALNATATRTTRLGFWLVTHIGLELLFGIHHVAEAHVNLFFQIVIVSVMITHTFVAPLRAPHIGKAIVKMTTGSALCAMGVSIHVRIQGGCNTENAFAPLVNGGWCGHPTG